MGDHQTQHKNLYKDLSESIKAVCRSHGVDFGSLRGWRSRSGFLFLNLLIHEEDIDKAYSQLYEEKANDLGLEKSWLGCYINNPDTNQSIKILGLDPDGGESCVRVEDDDGNRMNIAPYDVLTAFSVKS